MSGSGPYRISAELGPYTQCVWRYGGPVELIKYDIYVFGFEAISHIAIGGAPGLCILRYAEPDDIDKLRCIKLEV